MMEKTTFLVGVLIAMDLLMDKLLVSAVAMACSPSVLRAAPRSHTLRTSSPPLGSLTSGLEVELAGEVSHGPLGDPTTMLNGPILGGHEDHSLITGRGTNSVWASSIISTKTESNSTTLPVTTRNQSSARKTKFRQCADICDDLCDI
jgi:hypothetical protein